MPEQCIFHKDKVISKIKEIIDGLNKTNTEAADANTTLEANIKTCDEEKAKLELANVALKEANDRLTEGKKKIEQDNKRLEEANAALKADNSTLTTVNEKLNEELTKNKTTQDEEINKLNNKLEKQEKTFNENKKKIISTLVSERNRLLEESNKEQEEALAKAKEADVKKAQAELAKAKEEAQKEALAEKEAALKAQGEAKTDAQKQQTEALAKAQEIAEQAKKEALEKAKTDAQVQLEKTQAKEAELQTALTKCNQEKEELKQATESMNNIEKIQNSTKLSMTDIQTKLWETANGYMESQFNDQNYQKTITSDPFVQVELKTLLNDDTEVTQDVTSEKIKHAHNKVIQRHYNTIYPNANNLEVPTKVTDHIVIPPYLYLSLTHFYTIFSFLNTRQFYMRFLDQVQELPLEPGFHIIIKKLGDGDQDFFSRVDVKFVLLETQTKAKEVIDKIFKESTFYGHIPTQTILQPGYTGNITAGGNKTLKNNKRRLKKRRKYTQSNRRK